MELPSQQTGPKAWLGSDLTGLDSWVWELSEAEVDQIVHERYSPALAAKIDSLRTELVAGRGFQLVRGLPVDELGPDSSGQAFRSFGTRLGSARSQNAAGDLLGHVRNVGADADDPNVRIYQTNQRQTFHTDSSDVVGLLCLETAQTGGESLLVSASTIYNRMLEHRPDLLEPLFEPIATDRRGEVPAGQEPFFTIPVLSWFDDELTVIYQRQYIESAQRFPEAPRLTARVVEALDLFDKIANDPAVHLRMTLAKGDMQFVHNHGLLHDRTEFVDDARAPRHLLRLWLSVDGDRRLPPIFAQRYGSVEVGDRGGIAIGS